jgi:hypothetical protein
VDRRVIPGQPHDPVPDELEIRVAVGVPLAVATGAVEIEAVELDDEPFRFPVRINLVSCGFSLNYGIEGGVVISGAVCRSLLKRRSSSLFWVLGS